MKLHITARDDNTIRIEGNEGQVCTIALVDTYARLLSVTIPEADRNNGQGSELLRAAEKQAKALGKDKMVADVADEVITKSFLQKNGYNTTKSEPILSIDISAILKSVGVRKTMGMVFGEVETESLDMLFEYELMDICDLLNKTGFPCDRQTLDRFIPSLSFVAYDEQLSPSALLLASDNQEQLMVSFLMGTSAKKPQYILAVCQAFIKAIEERSLEQIYPHICLLSSNKKIMPLMKRLLDKDVSIDECEQIIHAEKDLDEIGEHISEEIADGLSPNQYKLDGHQPIHQADINDKCIWMDAHSK